jgi:5-methylcytosine-specific restriction protein A
MRTFSDFCAYLGCPLTNIRWSWSAISPDGRRTIFTLWDDEIKNRTYVLYPTSERRPREIPDEANARLGAQEIRRIAETVVADATIEAFGILSIVKDKDATPRERKTYDDRTVFRLRIEKNGESFIAHLVSRPSVSEITSTASGA